MKYPSPDRGSPNLGSSNRAAPKVASPNLASPNLASRQLLSPGCRRLVLSAAIALGMLLATPPLGSQAPVSSAVTPASLPVITSSGKIAAIKSFRIVQEEDGSALEILSTQPLAPTIQTIANPDRLVIDLPNARLDTQDKRINVEAHQISAVRANQFQQNPPIARLVVDLLAPRAYTWDAAGNRLVVHLGRGPGEADISPFQLPAVPSLTPAPRPIVTAVRAAGPLTLLENSGGTGSSITAGPETAILSLSSGGKVHVCPGTTVSVTASQNHHNLMLSMNTGALEAHFALDTSSDSVMTPDFHILLVGPGEFHYAISADTQGNTCVRALPGNTASAIVNELLGDRTYQVKATDQLMFRSGQLDRVDMNVPLECGCPPPRAAPLRAESVLPMDSRSQEEREQEGRDGLPPLNVGPATDAPALRAVSAGSTGIPATADASVSAANEVHVQIEAPFVFHATGPAPAPVEEVGALPLDSRLVEQLAVAAPLAPSTNDTPKPIGTETAAKPAPSRGFFKRIRGLFSALFH